MIKKLTEEEIKNLKEIYNQRQELIQEIGEIEINRIIFENKKIEFKNKFKEFQKKEEEIGSIFHIKYGNGNIDIEKGEIEIID